VPRECDRSVLENLSDEPPRVGRGERLDEHIVKIGVIEVMSRYDALSQIARTT
jgi:hypothetical protein